MRMLLLSSEFPPYRGGISTYAVEMANAACQLGAEVTVAVPDFGASCAVSDLNYPFRIVRFQGGLHTIRDVPAKCALVKRLLREAEYDLVHAMDWPFFFPVSLFARSKRRLYTIHGSDVNDMSSGYKPLLIRLFRVFCGNVDVVANSSFTRQLFLKKMPYVERAKVRYELLGVSEFWKEDVAVSSSDRESLGLPNGKFVIVTVGRLTPRKNQIGVIDALKLLDAERRAGICYAIVGPAYDKSYSDAVRDAALNAGLDVRLLGQVTDEDLRRVYRNSDLFCLVGKPIPNGPVEGFGLVFLEAGGQKLPSLAGDIGGVGEVVLNDYNGILIPVDSPSIVAGSIAALMDSRQSLHVLGTGARARAMDLSWRRCAAATYLLPNSPEQ